MTERVVALTVILETDTREDDAEKIIDAILMIKGVMEVKPHMATPEVYFAQETARRELRNQIIEILRYEVKAER